VSATLLALATGCGGSSSANGGTEVLYFSAIPDANKSDLAEKYGRIAEHLSQELGVPVEYRPSSSYAASVEAFKNGDVQLAWFGGVTGVQARKAVPGAQAIAQGRVDPEYKSYFIAHRDTGLTRSEAFPVGLEGKSFTFGSPDSTSGRVMPEFFIRESTGRSPEEVFGHPNKFSNGHDLTALQVQAGTVDAGALSYKKYDSMIASGDLDPEVCVIVWETPAYPDYNWTAHPALEERFGAGFTGRVAETLVAITDEELLGALDRPEGLIPATNADFAAIEDTMVVLGMARN
jgi:phosphonate transport system substrate-binding protein